MTFRHGAASVQSYMTHCSSHTCCLTCCLVASLPAEQTMLLQACWPQEAQLLASLHQVNAWLLTPSPDDAPHDTMHASTWMGLQTT
jgi:hypothetical protein